MKKMVVTAICLVLGGALCAQPGPQVGERRGQGARPGAGAWADRQTSRSRVWQARERLAAFGQHRDVPTTRIVQRMKEVLALTPEQEKKVHEILEKAKSELGESVGSVRELGEKTREKLREILTEEQRIKLDKLRQNAREVGAEMVQERGPQLRQGVERMAEEGRMRLALRSLNLTEEQRQQIEEVQKATRAKIQAIQEEVKPKIEAAREEAKKKIEEILTPEQREQLKKELEKAPLKAWKAAPGPGKQMPGKEFRPNDMQGPRPHRPDAGKPQAFGWRPPLPGMHASAPDVPQMAQLPGPPFAPMPGPSMQILPPPRGSEEMWPPAPEADEGEEPSFHRAPAPPVEPAPAGPPARDILLELFA